MSTVLPHRPLMRVMVVAVALALSGCMAVPRTVEVYDPSCRSMMRRVVLDEVQIGAIAGCANQGCVALVVGASAFTAATYLVSGTIMVVGNVAYEVERRVQCNPADASPVIAPAPAP